MLNKGSCLARALGVTKFINMRDMILVTIVVLLKSDLGVHQTHLRIVPGSTVVEQGTRNSKIRGLSPAACKGRERKWRFFEKA